MEFEGVVAELEARKPERIKPSLDRIRALSDLLDHPELTFRSIHITGTNGKTTTARLAARILCGQGLTTGLYTSPHLSSVRERVALCNEPIGKEEFVAAYEHLRPYLEAVDGAGDPLSYFETLTGLAYLWMADKPVGAGVYEVGMGGTWDATNLVRGEVAVFTEIGLDHPELGSTVEEVAGEKGGIVKLGATLVVAEQSPEALAVIEARAADLGATVLLEDRDFHLADRELAVDGQRLAVTTSDARYEDLFLPLHGIHQAHNAALAVAACEALLEADLDPGGLREALAGAMSPGRLEVVARHPTVVLDGAHNPGGARALAEALTEAFVWGRLHLVLGVLEEKDLEGIVGALAPVADLVHACASRSPRARRAEDTARACERAGLPVSTHESVEDALESALVLATEGDLVLVTGSLYTVADARPRFVKD